MIGVSRGYFINSFVCFLDVKISVMVLKVRCGSWSFESLVGSRLYKQYSD